MTFKQFFCGKDYQTTLRRRLCLCIAMGLLGILVFILSFATTLHNNLSDSVSAGYAGGGLAATTYCILSIIRITKLLRNPEKARQTLITEEDERERAITNSSIITTFRVLFWVIIAGIFITLPLCQPAFFTLIALFVLTLVVRSIATVWHRRHM